MSSSPRVLLVVQRLPPERLAGAEVQAAQLASHLHQLGASVEVLSTCFVPGLPAREQRDGVLVHRLTVPRPLLRAPARYAAAWWFVRRHARRFDVVHGFCLSATVLGAAAGASRAGLPVLLRPSLSGAQGDLARLEARLGRPVVSRLLKSADRWLVLDDEAQTELLRHGVGAERMRVVDNGVDLERYRPAVAGERGALRAKLGLPEGPLVLFVGQLVERKGVRLLLRAFEQVRARVADASLVLVGAGPLSSELRGAGIFSLGARHDVDELLRAADVFTLPSAAEGFSNALLEALASGLPVVTTTAAAPARLGLGPSAGSVIEPRDQDALTTSLWELLADPARRERAGREARALASRYSLERVAADSLALYAELVAEESSSYLSHEAAAS